MAPPLSTPLLITLGLLLLLAHRIIAWRQRSAFMRKSMPVVTLLLEPHSVLRRFIPQKWQTWHDDWMFQNRELAKDCNTGFIPVICLFGHDLLYVSDVDAIVEIASSPLRFPKDLRVYGNHP
jgi:hypothetical protein